MALKGAFYGCKWCHGNGCMGCDDERRKAQERAMQPIFTAQRDDPEDMAALKRVFHADVLNKAFGPGGGGMAEIEEKAAIESLKQCLRKLHEKKPEPAVSNEAVSRPDAGGVE